MTNAENGILQPRDDLPRPDSKAGETKAEVLYGLRDIRGHNVGEQLMHEIFGNLNLDLILVMGEAGNGKTTAISQILSETERHKSHGFTATPIETFVVSFDKIRAVFMEKYGSTDSWSKSIWKGLNTEYILQVTAARAQVSPGFSRRLVIAEVPALPTFAKYPDKKDRVGYDVLTHFADAATKDEKPRINFIMLIADEQIRRRKAAVVTAVENAYQMGKTGLTSLLRDEYNIHVTVRGQQILSEAELDLLIVSHFSKTAHKEHIERIEKEMLWLVEVWEKDQKLQHPETSQLEERKFNFMRDVIHNQLGLSQSIATVAINKFYETGYIHLELDPAA